jgi:hypothetical protein
MYDIMSGASLFVRNDICSNMLHMLNIRTALDLNIKYSTNLNLEFSSLLKLKILLLN